MIMKNKIFLVITLLAIAAGIYYLENQKTETGSGGSGDVPASGSEAATEVRAVTIEEKAKMYPRAAEIVAPAGFINSDGFTVSEFIGKKVILVDFWTYSCINCQRTMPYLTRWYDKYKDEGLIILGIHTPEFDFEKNIENVRLAAQKFGVEYPVVLDNDYGTWRNYGNRYWPRKYLIDIDGFIVYDHIGEGGYEETEKKIQELLRERRMALGEDMDISGDIVDPSVGEYAEGVGSPEVYFGSSRNSLLANGESGRSGEQIFPYPSGIRQNELYLGGDWNITPEYAENISPNAKIIFRYRAKNVFMVLESEKPNTIEIYRDGKPISVEKGSDVMIVDGIPAITVKEPRLYRIIEDPEGSDIHTLEINVTEPGLQAFTFTFG